MLRLIFLIVTTVAEEASLDRWHAALHNRRSNRIMVDFLVSTRQGSMYFEAGSLVDSPGIAVELELAVLVVCSR